MFFFGAMGLVAQYTADTIGYTIKNFDGVPLESNILTIIDVNEINTRTANIVEGNFTGNTTITGNYNRIEVPEVAGAFVAWEMIQLITGTYIFQLLILFGVPTIMVVPMVIVYVLLLAIFIWTSIRGI